MNILIIFHHRTWADASLVSCGVDSIVPCGHTCSLKNAGWRNAAAGGNEIHKWPAKRNSLRRRLTLVAALTWVILPPARKGFWLPPTSYLAMEIYIILVFSIHALRFRHFSDFSHSGTAHGHLIRYQGSLGYRVGAPPHSMSGRPLILLRKKYVKNQAPSGVQCIRVRWISKTSAGGTDWCG